MGEQRTWRHLGTTAFCHGSSTDAPKNLWSLLSPASSSPAHRGRAVCIQCLAGNWALTPAGAFRPHWNKKRIVPPIGMGAHTNLLVQEIHLPGGLARREVPQDHITQPHHPAHHSARPLGAPPVLPKPNPKNHENNFLDGQKSRRPVNSHTIACAPCI